MLAELASKIGLNSKPATGAALVANPPCCDDPVTVKEAEVCAQMKGPLHSDEPMSAVVRKDNDLRTPSRIGHVFVMNAPT